MDFSFNMARAVVIPRLAAVSWLLASMAACGAPETAPEDRALRTAAGTRHIKVYFEEGRFGGWPANHGIWIWGNEILVGFSKGYYKDLGDRHHIDREKPEAHMLARSLDGGETWAIEDPAAQGYLIPEGDALREVPACTAREVPASTSRHSWRATEGSTSPIPTLP